MPTWLLPVICLLYISLLFAVAWWGDQRSLNLSPSRQSVLYSLTLAVYCTTWTLYGAVGAGISGGWVYLPIYLGPLLFVLFARPLLDRLILSSQAQSITSIADFISARYGKAQHLGALVALIALLGALPYIALQLQAVAMSVEVLNSAGLGRAFPPGDTALWTGFFLALLAIVFGTRRIDATEHHQGLMLAVALESVVKLMALVAVAVFALWQLHSISPAWMQDPRLDQLFRPQAIPSGFLAQTLLAFLAIICLPRQFHVAVVECTDVRVTRQLPLWFGSYLVLIALAVLPIASLALLQPAGWTANPDSAVLTLPLAAGQDGLAILAFLGGLSAAAGMVIVASVALSTMICNDLVVPLLLRYRRFGQRPVPDQLLLIRRLAIVGVLLLSYGYYQVSLGNAQLAAVGLLSFSAVAQFAPALLGGVLWRGGSQQGVTAGLLAGFSVWLYTLMLPALVPAMGWDRTWIDHGLFGLAWLKPQALFYLTGWDALTHGVFWSLLINLSLFVLISLRFRPGIREQLEASAFLDPQSPHDEPANFTSPRLSQNELFTLVARILGQQPTLAAFEQFARGRMQHLDLRQPASRAWIQFAERLLASAMGTASARALLTTALRGTGLEIGQVVDLLDRTSQQQRFNREVLTTMMEHIEQGISVVDAQLRLVAWNTRYLELFDYPPGMVYEGCPIADLIRYNAERGECGPGEVEGHVARRLQHLREATPHQFERTRPDGQVIEMRGRPIPGGGFVTTFADITPFKQTERRLAEAKTILEQRVAERTEELERARQAAEHANQSKTRFLAAASHDLLQPMNAARLFSSAINQHPTLDAEAERLAQQLDASLRGAEALLSALLDISRMDAGALNPSFLPINLTQLVQELVDQHRPVAEQRHLQLRYARPTAPVWVWSDRQWLRRIVQNLLSNALRYTRDGGVLVGLRRWQGQWRLDVRDTGPGIPAGKLGQIFEEFQRGGESSPWGEKGLGLGLAIVDRMVRLLGHQVSVSSIPGRGACFTVLMARAAAAPETDESPNPPASAGRLEGLRVLCIDNEPDILAGMSALLSRWGCQVQVAAHEAEARAQQAHSPPEVLLCDFHLDDEADGLDLLMALKGNATAALVTADHSDELAQRCRLAGVSLLRKPVKPAALRAFLQAVVRS